MQPIKNTIAIPTKSTEIVEPREKSLAQLKKENALTQTYLGSLSQILSGPELEIEVAFDEVSQIIQSLNENLMLMEDDPGYEPTISHLVLYHQMCMAHEHQHEIIEELQAELEALKDGHLEHIAKSTKGSEP